MPKLSLFVRNIFLHPMLEASIEKQIVDTSEVKPGQLRKKADWYYLTYLRVVKLKNFNALTYEMDETEASNIRVVSFKIKDNKLLVSGSKNDIKEIATYFEALTLPLNPDDSPDVKTTDFFRIDVPVVDLKLVIELLEKLEAAQDIKKIRMKKIEVALGRIDNCVINTQDYGKSRSLLGEEEGGAFGMEVFLKQPEKTSVYFDQDAQIRVITKSDTADVDELATAFAVKLP